MSWQVNIVMEPSLVAVRRAAAIFKTALAEVGTQQERQELELAFVEACTNSAVHGSNGECPREIRVSIAAGSTEVKVVIEDTGKPFNPFMEERQIDFNDIESLPCGGFGLSLIRRICDSVDYEHDGRGNRLTLRKGVSCPEATTLTAGGG